MPESLGGHVQALRGCARAESAPASPRICPDASPCRRQKMSCLLAFVSRLRIGNCSKAQPSFYSHLAACRTS